MAQYLVTGPDGTKYRVTGPDGASDEEVLSQVKEYSASTPATPVAAAPQAPKAPEDKRSDARKMQDMASMPGDMIGSAVRSAVAAPIANMAGLARTAWEGFTGGSKGDGDAGPKTREGVRNVIAPPMQNPEVGKLMAPVGAVAAPVGRLLHAGADALRGDGPANAPRGMAANAAIEGAKQAPNFLGLGAVSAVPKVTRAVEGFADNLAGTSTKVARSEVMATTRDALTDVERSHAATQATKMTEAQAYEDAATRAEAQLKAASQRTGTPTVDVIGEQARGDYLKVMTDAKAARAKEVEPLYAKARAAAAAREAQGQFVDVKPAVKDLDEMLQLSENLPDLHGKLLKLRQSVESVTPKAEPAPPVGGGKVTSKMAVPATPAAPARPLSYSELDMASRYVKDIAFSGEAEGYGALIRNTAKRLSVKLDEQISKAVPEHAAATAKYRELSEPMETLATRIGSALYDTEGGLKGEAYAKVSAQDLPGRVFSKKDRVEQLVDALAGGKKATPQARAAAQAKVDTWVENWILDSKRGKVGDAARVDAPGQRAALNAAPGAAQRLDRAFSTEQGLTQRVPELKAGAKASRAEADAAAGSRARVQSALQDARALEQGSSEKMKKMAYDKYVEAFRQSMDPADPRYRAGIALIDRASTLEEKTARARKLAMGVAGVVGVAGAAGLGVQIPGVLK